MIMMPVRRTQNWLPSIFNDFFDNDWMVKANATAPAINVLTLLTICHKDADYFTCIMPILLSFYLILFDFHTNLKRIRQRLFSSSQSWLIILNVPISDVLATCVPMQRHSS